MFIPLGFEHGYERRPWATGGLVVVNVVVGLFTFFRGYAPSFGGFALDPETFRLHQLVTSSFLHGGPFHLVGNLAFLWPFGRIVEDRLGPWRFLGLWFATDVVASLAYLAFGGPLPCVGASGAIAGLMGWVLVAAPWLELRFFFFLLPYASRSYELPVAWLLVPWIGMQLLVGWAGASGSVAISAHVGGFAAGAAAAAVMRSRWCVGTPWFIDPRPPTDGAAVVDRLHRARAAGAIKR